MVTLLKPAPIEGAKAGTLRMRTCTLSGVRDPQGEMIPGLVRVQGEAEFWEYWEPLSSHRPPVGWQKTRKRHWLVSALVYLLTGGKVEDYHWESYSAGWGTVRTFPVDVVLSNPTIMLNEQ